MGIAAGVAGVAAAPSQARPESNAGRSGGLTASGMIQAQWLHPLCSSLPSQANGTARRLFGLPFCVGVNEAE